jgi:hypothetical protein
VSSFCDNSSIFQELHEICIAAHVFYVCYSTFHSGTPPGLGHAERTAAAERAAVLDAQRRLEAMVGEVEARRVELDEAQMRVEAERAGDRVRRHSRSRSRSQSRSRSRGRGHSRQYSRGDKHDAEADGSRTEDHDDQDDTADTGRRHHAVQPNAADISNVMSQLQLQQQQYAAAAAALDAERATLESARAAFEAQRMEWQTRSEHTQRQHHELQTQLDSQAESQTAMQTRLQAQVESHAAAQIQLDADRIALEQRVRLSERDAQTTMEKSAAHEAAAHTLAEQRRALESRALEMQLHESELDDRALRLQLRHVGWMSGAHFTTLHFSK